ncbi:hypothetical protein AAFF_G00008400 [Aldrovandia affinis]|uniref:Uncharacterized protein n=1 Tax=Aldrovandia affinis TaxID=143900 RepID=A0AAD7T688_9TELE|nr:hypothetical protein AAFF_G00008400 [Aldrovandia affinis]
MSSAQIHWARTAGQGYQRSRSAGYRSPAARDRRAQMEILPLRVWVRECPRLCPKVIEVTMLTVLSSSRARNASDNDGSKVKTALLPPASLCSLSVGCRVTVGPLRA